MLPIISKRRIHEVKKDRCNGTVTCNRHIHAYSNSSARIGGRKSAEELTVYEKPTDEEVTLPSGDEVSEEAEMDYADNIIELEEEKAPVQTIR